MDIDSPIRGVAPRKMAAAYVRMSNDGRGHSIQHQLDHIHAYALSHQLEIVRTFADAGISGIKAANRPGLQAMLLEVAGGTCGFSVIVVYDVSRWGVSSTLTAVINQYT